MTRDEAFIQAVIEAPEDDTPRLVYADWLDENGDAERAEFIRVGCALARLEYDDPRYPALFQREVDLWARNKQHWLQPVPQWAINAYMPFRRGFVAEVNSTVAYFLRGAPTLFRVTPVQRIKFYRAKGRIADLAACRHLERLPGLSFFHILEVGDEGTALLARSPHLARLRRLELAGGGRFHLGPGAAEALAESETLNHLIQLDLPSNRLGRDGGEALANGDGLPRLAQLDLSGCQIGPRAAAALLRSPKRQALATLNLFANDLGDEGARAVADHRLPALSDLDLSTNRIGPEGAQALAGSPNLARLKRLNLGGNVLGLDGVRVLLSSPHLTGLTDLGLDLLNLTDEDVRTLAALPGLGRIRRLSLTLNQIGDEGVRALAASPLVAGLTTLRLEANRVGDAGARALAESPYLGRLQRLILFNRNHISAEARQALQERFRCG
jgi:uncharacterized protein (TIGR02996 family)